MTSCVLSLLVFVFLCSSISVSAHTGVRVRITNRAQDVLKETGLMFLRTLVNKPYGGFTVTSLDLHHIDLQFQDSKLQFVITDLNLAGRTDSFNGEVRASTTIGLRVSKTPDGRLNALMPNCELRFDKIDPNFTGKGSTLVNFLLKGVAWGVGHLPSSWLCAAVNWWIIPGVNNWLGNMTMVTILPKNVTRQMMLPERLDVKIDYSLSGEVEMTPNGIDVPFKGLVFCQDEAVVPDLQQASADPVFTENDMMAYVGISEFFFNSAALSIHSARAMEHTDEVTHGGEKAALRFLQFFRKINHLLDPLSHEVEVTEVPNFGISQKDGLTVTVRARFRAITPSAANEPSSFMSVSARCQVSVKVAIEENHLTLPSDNVDCKIITKNKIRDTLVKPLNAVLMKMARSYLQGAFNNANGTGIPIPLPEGISFTQSKIDYHDGFLVAGGSIGWTPAGRQNLANLIG